MSMNNKSTGIGLEDMGDLLVDKNGETSLAKLARWMYTVEDRLSMSLPAYLKRAIIESRTYITREAAVEEWLKKCKRWYQYTSEQHYANVDPVLVVQVCQGHNGALSDTNLEDVLAKINAALDDAATGTSWKTTAGGTSNNRKDSYAAIGSFSRNQDSTNYEL